MLKEGAPVQRDLLRDPKYLEVYLQDHHRKGPAEFRLALREAILSQKGGLAAFARRAGLGRTGLYKALSAGGNPSHQTIDQVLDALGMRTVIARKEGRRAGRERAMDQTKGHAKSAQKPVAQEVQKAQETQKNRILPGSGKGLFVMADDFDAPLPEFSE